MMNRTKIRWKSALIVAGIAGVASAGLIAGTAIAGTMAPIPAPNGLSAADGLPTTPIPTPVYETNASGETFGSIASVPSADSGPDLVLVVATNGTEGYARSADLAAAEGSGFKSPEKALAWQSAHAGESQTIPVYDVDGKTVIGEFVVAGPQGQVAPKP